jgi:hypothetical protein
MPLSCFGVLARTNIHRQEFGPVGDIIPQKLGSSWNSLCRFDKVSRLIDDWP